MPKRKGNDNASDSDSDEGGIVDVDFEFFDPNEHDYHAVARLLRQLFQNDAELFHVPQLTELILSQPLVGTTIKTDGRESDPLALLTVLNMHVHAQHPSIKALIAYFFTKAAHDMPALAELQRLLGPTGLEGEEHVGLIISERLVNMPVQVVPPMYSMLANEVQWANDEKEPYRFSHFLFITRTYRLTPEEESELMDLDGHKPPKKRKGQPTIERTAGPAKGGTFSFHPEDECIQELSTHSYDYSFTDSQPREADSFGVDTAGRAMIVPVGKFRRLQDTLKDRFSVSPSTDPGSHDSTRGEE